MQATCAVRERLRRFERNVGERSQVTGRRTEGRRTDREIQTIDYITTDGTIQ
jgi:hypothetical protein